MTQPLMRLIEVDSPMSSEREILLKYIADYKDISYAYEVDVDTARRYKGNLYGLFKYIGIDSSEWILCARKNGYISPSDFDGEPTTIIQCSTVEINEHVKKELRSMVSSGR